MDACRFGPFVLEPREGRLLRGGDPVPLTPKAFDVLVYLVERHGQLVGKDELLDAIWGGSFVEEGSLPRLIHVLRRALAAAEDGKDPQPQFIETVPTRGYRFVAAVGRLDAPAPVPDVAIADSPSAPDAARPGRIRRAVLVAVAALLGLALAGVVLRDRGPQGTLTADAARETPETSSGAAYVRYLRGRLHLERKLAGDVDSALADFEAAIGLDPAFASAHAGKADARFFRYWATGSHDDILQARLAIRRAIELDGRSAYAHALQCRLLATYDWDFAGAEAACRSAVEFDSGNAEARREMGFLLNALGRRADALKELDAAVAMAPTSFNKRSRGLLLYFDRRFDDAIAQLRQVEATDPEYTEASRWIARCHEQKGEYEEAFDALVRSRAAAGAAPEEILALRRAFENAGWPGVLRATLPDGRPAPPNLEAAGTYAQLGARDAAFAVLESMISARRLMIVHMDSDPRLDPVRADPRYERLATRVGLR